MSPLIALLVGLIQGVLEWLPISSQGNLVLIMLTLLHFDPLDALSLSVYLHVGTGLAAMIYFRKDLAKIFSARSEPDRRLLYYLVSATLATILLGLPLFLFAKLTSFHGEALLSITGGALILTGLIERSAKSRGTYSSSNLDLKDGFLIGLIQGLSAVPGISRSGVTTSALLFKGLSGEEAFRVSFLMSIPSVFTAALGLMFLEGLPKISPNLSLALIASLLSAILSIDLLIRAARRMRFWGLCIALGVTALLPSLLYLV